MNNLKDYRNNELKSYVIGNILLILHLSGAFSGMISVETGISEALSTVLESAVFSSIIYIYVFFLDSILPGDYKQKIAFLPSGKLPGYTIFSKMKEDLKDDRFTLDDVMKKYGEVYQNMPEDTQKKEQYENAQWFKIYRSHQDESKIFTANRDFLLCRDITVITLDMMVIYLACTFVFGFFPFSSRMIFVFLGEMVVADIAMRGKANRLAYNVISVDVHE